MIQIIGEHFRIIIMEHSITGLMSEVRDAIIKEQFIQEQRSGAYAFINTNFGERVTFDAGW